MESSTPLRRKDVQRRSLLNTSVVSPLSKSSSTLPSPVVLLNRTDDEAERSSRRSAVSLQRRLTNISRSRASSVSNELNGVIEESQIQDHLRICTKLYVENKISTKNAWELHIIDIIRKIAVTNNKDVLQVAGSSLDIGAKVYAIRVDDLHTKGLKLASSMTRNNEAATPPENDASNNDEGGADAPNKNGPKRKKKLRSDKANTLDKEKKNLFAPFSELKSVSFATKENIDVSAIDNLFTSKLCPHPITGQLMLMRRDKYWSNLAIEKRDHVIDIELPNENIGMVLPLKDFEIGEWDPEKDEPFNMSVAADVIFDENGAPIAELDGSIHDIFEDNHDAPEEPMSENEENHCEEFRAQIHGEIGHIVDAIPEENRIETDYGYNAYIRSSTGKFIDRIWAGPNHWKVKYIRRSALRFSGNVHLQQVTKSRKTKTKVYAPVQFDCVLKDCCEEFKKIVAKRAPASTSFEKTTFPVPELSYENFHKETSEFLTKPGVLVPIKKKIPHELEEIRIYNYENLNDSNYVSQNSVNDGNDDPGDHIFENEDGPEPLPNFLDENGFDIPEMIPASQVPYAMQAKKMDMKKLKSTVWKLLTQNDQDDYKSTVTPISFSNLYRKLPPLLNTDMQKELSYPIAFVALLHLCNEKNLKLYQHPHYKDFTIMKAEKPPCK